MDGLLSVSVAQQKLLDFFTPVETDWMPLAHIVGRVLAEDVFAPADLPPFANSTVDGFSVRAQDIEHANPESPVKLKVTGDIAAGQVADLVIEGGQSARIMTGAPIPNGADAVVMVENTDFKLRQPGLPAPRQVQVYQPVKAGENIRPKGQDIRSGQRVMEAGRQLRPQEVGLLAMLGFAELKIYRKPRVALLSTGDELVQAGELLPPGKIHDANTHFLSALIEQAGCETMNLGIAADRFDAVKDRLDQAFHARADLILSSAGVSIGAFDYVRSVVEQNGELAFWRVNMRPGKPLASGRYRNIPFIGLPGNPVSAFTGFEVFVKPALMKLAGFNQWHRLVQKVYLSEAVESDGRESYLRGIVYVENGKNSARLTGHQGSGNLFSLVQANALLIIPSGVKSLPVGAEVDAWMLDWLSPGYRPG